MAKTIEDLKITVNWDENTDDGTELESGETLDVIVAKLANGVEKAQKPAHPDITTKDFGQTGGTLSFGGVFPTFVSLTRDENGHVTGGTQVTLTMPDNPAEGLQSTISDNTRRISALESSVDTLETEVAQATKFTATAIKTTGCVGEHDVGCSPLYIRVWSITENIPIIVWTSGSGNVYTNNNGVTAVNGSVVTINGTSNGDDCLIEAIGTVISDE